MKTVKTLALVILAAFSLAAFSGCKEKTMTNVQYVLRNNSSHMLEIIHPKIGDNTLMPGENFQFSFTYKVSRRTASWAAAPRWWWTARPSTR